MTTMAAIRVHVHALPQGEPFTSSDLLSVGTRASVDQALSRMVRSGAIERIYRGVFVRPRTNRYVGKVPPAPEKVAQAVARASQSVIEVHGVEAAREFGLTTQVPMRAVFLTSGRSRVIRLFRLNRATCFSRLTPTSHRSVQRECGRQAERHQVRSEGQHQQ